MSPALVLIIIYAYSLLVLILINRFAYSSFTRTFKGGALTLLGVAPFISCLVTMAFIIGVISKRPLACKMIEWIDAHFKN